MVNRHKSDALGEEQVGTLLEAAEKARTRAYVPYSHFPVGAALLTKSGQVVLGANFENASYGATICAERGAVANAIALGEREFAAIAVIADFPEPVPPCGTCRQVLAEFAPDMPVIMANLHGERRIATVRQLLPGMFHLPDADQAGDNGVESGLGGAGKGST